MKISHSHSLIYFLTLSESWPILKEISGGLKSVWSLSAFSLFSVVCWINNDNSNGSVNEYKKIKDYYWDTVRREKIA